jgi:hypothetical protein
MLQVFQKLLALSGQQSSCQCIYRKARHFWYRIPQPGKFHGHAKGYLLAWLSKCTSRHYWYLLLIQNAKDVPVAVSMR